MVDKTTAKSEAGVKGCALVEFFVHEIHSYDNGNDSLNCKDDEHLLDNLVVSHPLKIC